MQLPPFKATIRKSGSSNIVTIPSDFIQQGYLDVGSEYEFVVKERCEDGEKDSLRNSA